MIKLFKEINCTNKVDDIFDKCVIDRNNWQMYGSRKPQHEAYRLTNVINYNYIFSDENSPMSLSKQLEGTEEPDLLMLKTTKSSLPIRSFFDCYLLDISRKYVYNYSEDEISKIEEIKIPDKEKNKEENEWN